MRKSSLRSFGIACFLIGALYASIDKFHITLPFIRTSSDAEVDQQYKEEITKLEEKLANTKQQISTLQEENLVKTQSAETQTTVETLKDKNTSPKQNVDEMVSATLYIYAGLTPLEIATKLKEMGIVNNSVEMELFLAQPEYARSIQKGQFELNSSMTVEEIADIITGK